MTDIEKFLNKHNIHLACDWLKARLAEPSSRVGIITFIGLVGVNISPQHQQAIIEGFALLASIVAFFTEEPAKPSVEHAEAISELRDKIADLEQQGSTIGLPTVAIPYGKML